MGEGSATATEADGHTLLSEMVTGEDIAVVISKQTGIPLSSLMQGEKDKLLHLESILGSKVVGQVCIF